MPMKITFLIPVCNERESLEPLAEGIAEHAAPHEHRILFVDDGSTDGSWEVLCRLHEQRDTVDLIRFRRNFGKSAALAAGFSRAEGDYVITMDGDLQDDPKEIPRLLEKLDEGCDVVVGWKQVRNDPWHKTIPSRVYNALVSRLFGLGLHDVNCGYKGYCIEVVRNVRVYGELHRLIPVLAADLGYSVTEIPVEHHPRRYGKSKYGFERFSRGAMDVLSVYFLSRYRYRPGHFFGKLGLGAVLLGVIGACAAGVAWAVFGHALPGIVLGVLSAGLLAGGLTVAAIGLAAEHLLRQHPPSDFAPYIEEERRH